MLVLPFNSDPQYTMTVTLDGSDYLFNVYWLDRVDAWFFDISDANGTSIFNGQRIATNMIISEAFSDIVTGRLIAISNDDNDDSDPGRNDLGERITILYASADEVL